MAKRTVYIPVRMELLLKKAENKGIKSSDLFCDALNYVYVKKDKPSPIKDEESYKQGYFRGVTDGRYELEQKIEEMASKISRAITGALKE